MGGGVGVISESVMSDGVIWQGVGDGCRLWSV